MKKFDVARQGGMIKEFRSAYPNPVKNIKGAKVSIETEESAWDSWLGYPTENGKERRISRNHVEIEFCEENKIEMEE